MTEVISVKFKSRGKTYYFAPGETEVPDGAQVVVETSKGLELCDCVKGNHYVLDSRIVPPLRPVVRLATPDDLRIAALCKKREKEAFAICEEKIRQHGLDMKLVDVECSFEGSKMLFFFTSDGRVDFRELVKDLAGIFRTRIELRQIGVRDEAKMLGGLGICGRPFCCSQFLDDFQPVSTKMAKTQSLSLNPTKISGTCGRLMCCLRYEQEAYEELVRTVPKNGAFVETPSGYGNVAQVNLLRQKVKVHIDGDDNGLKSFDADEVAAVPGGRPKPGEPLPHVLTVKAKKVEEPEEPDDSWNAPDLFAGSGWEAASPSARETPATEKSDEAGRDEGSESGEKKRQRRPRHRKPQGDGEQKPRQTRGESAEKPVEKRQTPEKKQDRAEKPAAEGSAAEGVEKKRQRRPRHRKPQGDGSSKQKQEQSRDGPEKPAEKRDARPPRQERAPKPAQEGQQEGAKPGDGQKKRGGHRRFRGNGKPRQGGNGGEKSGGTPQAQ